MTKLVDDILELKRKCGIDAEISAAVPLTARESSLLDMLRAESSPRAHDLARRMHLSASRGSRLIASLSGKGLLRLAPDAADRRAVRIVLTPKGVRLAERIEVVKCACENRLLKKLSGTDIQKVRQGLALLLEAL